MMRDLTLADWTERLAWLAVLAAATLAPFQPIRPLADGTVVDLRTTPALGALAVGLWLLALTIARRRPHFPWPLTPALAVFLGAALLSAALAPTHHLEALKFTARLALGGALALAAADLLVTPRRRWTLAVALVAAGAAQGLLGIAEFVAIPPLLSLLGAFKVAPSQVGDQVRVSGTFIYTTITSMYFELVIPFAVALLWRLVATRRWLATAAVAAALSMMLTAMILTFTRSGLLATLAALVGMTVAAAWGGGRQPAAVTAGVAVVLVGLVAAFAWVTPALALRLQTENDRAWYGAEYAVAPLPPIAAGETVTVMVTITNTGRLGWYSTPTRAYNLAYHWLAHDENSVAVWEGDRTPLPADVAPGEAIAVQARLSAPPHSGPLRLGWDMVQDNVTWFSAKAVAMGIQRVEVQPRRVTPAVEPPPILLQPMPRASAVDLSPGRRVLWGVALTMLADRPLLGVGPDNFRLAYGRYTGQTVWDTGVHANNVYLEIFADLGILGGVAFLFLTAVSLWTAWQALRRTHLSAPDFPLAAAAAASLTAWLVHGVFDFFYPFLPVALILWTILGLLAALARRDTA